MNKRHDGTNDIAIAYDSARSTGDHAHAVNVRVVKKIGFPEVRKCMRAISLEKASPAR